MVLDSNILIDYLNGDIAIRSKLHAWRERRSVLFISLISMVEVLSYPFLSAADFATIENFLDDFIVVPLDITIAREAAHIRRTHKLSTPDAIIVASAIVNKLPLVTRDKKMRSVRGVVLVDI